MAGMPRCTACSLPAARHGTEPGSPVKAIERRLSQAWYGGALPPAWARALEPLYTGAVRLRRLAYQRGWRASGHPGKPVIVVGNLTAGGTGKTPLVQWLVGELDRCGAAPAVVSRGYGGAEPRQPHLVAIDDPPELTGDEPLLIARSTGRPVWVCRDRLAAARAAVAAGAGVVIADDGLQHLRLSRDVELMVVDSERGLGNGRCLPAGPLREPAARLKRVDAVICNGEGPRCPGGGIRMRLTGNLAIRIGDGESRELESFRGRRVHAVAGIGNPERFFRSLEASGLEITRHPLGDHELVADILLAPPDGCPVLMTSKDAMRCAHRPAAAAAWHVPVRAVLDEDGAGLLALLAERIGLPQA
jgi:tetraacyldisaccharide 4'-kinase